MKIKHHSHMFQTILMAYSGYDNDGIDMGVDIHTKNAEGKDPLHVAVMMGDVEYVRFLLSLGSDQIQDGYGETPIFIAKFRGYTEIVKLLLADGLILTDKGNEHMNDIQLRRLHEIGYSVFLTRDKVAEIDQLIKNEI